MAETGMETLWDGESPVSADVIFVHGLRGNRIRTWEKGTVVWPRDLLKDEIPNARIMTWGYDADTMHFMSASGQSSIAALSEQLLDDLADERRLAETRERPIVFVAHSLGGLIVKDALWQSYIQGRTENIYFPRKAAIKNHTIGIVFAGTPHRGSDQAKWPLIATNIATKVLKDNNPRLIQALTRGSETLERLQNDFSKIALSLPIHTFTEDHNLALNQKVVENDSAVLGFPNEGKGFLPGDHVGMVKFSSASETGYKRISSRISGLIDDANSPKQPEVRKRVRNIYAIAIRRYTAVYEAHISFEEGETIGNIKFIHRDYWLGQVRGKVGLFHRDCVEIREENDIGSSTPTRRVSNRQSWKPLSSVAPANTLAQTTRIPFRPAPETTSEPTREPPRSSDTSRETTGNPLNSPPELSGRSQSTRNGPTPDQIEAFWISIEEGNLEGVKKQVSKGVDVNLPAQGGSGISAHGTPLVTACANGHEDIVRFLLQSGARPNQSGNPSSTCLPLHTAAFWGHAKIVKILLSKGALPMAQGGSFRFALTAAAAGAQVRVINILLDNDAQINARDQENETALHGAVWGGSLEAVQTLIQKGIETDVKGEQGTPLEMAMDLRAKGQPGQWREIILLLSHNEIDVGPDEQPQASQSGGDHQTQEAPLDSEGEADAIIVEALQSSLQDLLGKSLLFAARDGKLDDVYELLQPPAPVEPNRIWDDVYGHPLNAAAAGGHLDVMTVLLERGADVSLRGGLVDYPLHFAALMGHQWAIFLLVLWGADVDQMGDTCRATPLQLAARKGELGAMRMLLSLGAEVNISAGQFGSALHAAASSGYDACLLLLHSGANPRALDENGLTTADVARAHNQEAAKQLLKQCGSGRAALLSPQRLMAWTMSLGGRVERLEAQQRAEREGILQQMIQRQE